jgi:hypothetical protein
MAGLETARCSDRFPQGPEGNSTAADSVVVWCGHWTAMDRHPQETWQQRQLLETEIERILFNRKLLDPKGNNNKQIIEVKALIPQFSAVDSNLFFTAF